MIVPPIEGIADGVDKADSDILISLATKVAGIGAILIEVGSWKGHSASIFGTVLRNLGGHLLCIDHWKGSPGVWHHEGEVDCLSTFRKNIKTLGLEEIVHPIVMESALAKTIIRDNIADLVFIDADHRYTSIKQDIGFWLPKVKEGGILCGHDCERRYTEFNPQEQQMLRDNCDTDYFAPLQCHAGVVRALYEHFGNDYEIGGSSKVWFKKLNQNQK